MAANYQIYRDIYVYTAGQGAPFDLVNRKLYLISLASDETFLIYPSIPASPWDGLPL